MDLKEKSGLFSRYKSLHSMSSSFSHQSASSGTKALGLQPLVKLNFLLQQNVSLQTKCEEIKRLCDACSIKGLIEIFPPLLHSIFGFSEHPHWKLHTLTPSLYSSQEYTSVFQFLAPNGCLFNVIQKLEADSTALFQFPQSMLPVLVAESFRRGNAVSWYQNKITGLRWDDINMNFSAMEYFLIMFAYFVIHPNTRKLAEWSGVDDILYISLFEGYLHHFFPLNNGALSLATSSPGHFPHHSTTFSPLQSFTSPLLRQPQLDTASLSSNHLQATKADIFLQILCDFWLGQNIEENLHEKEYMLPTVDHGRVVRILVKYLHMFTNSKRSLSFDSPVSHFVNIAVPTILNERLYLYLSQCFLHWPFDSGFRMILETWLSFIQPWRYQDNNKTMALDDETLEVDFAPWSTFISSNLVFYSSMFQLFLSRAQRYDLTSASDVLLVYRVAKVFSQRALMDMLQEADAEMCHGRTGSSRLTGGFNSLFTQVCADTTKEKYRSMFGSECTDMVKNLCQSLSTAVIGLRHHVLQTKPCKRSAGFITCVREFFMLDDYKNTGPDDQRVIEYLERSCDLLTTVFKLPPLPTYPPENIPLEERPHLSRAPTGNQPDSVMTSQGLMLTDRGRFQVVQGLRRFDEMYTGDRELLPVRSDESTTAVRWLYNTSTQINEKYGEQIKRLYNRNDVIGPCLRKISKKLEPSCDNTFHPRVSLRFAASYYFMGYFCWLIALARLFGCPWVYIFTIVIFALCTCVLSQIDSSPLNERKED